MNDMATLMGKPTPLKVGDEVYQIFPLTFDDHGDVQRWLDAQQRDPFAIVQEQIATGRFSVEVQKFMVKSALEIAARSRVFIGSPEADGILESIEGRAFLLYLSIRKGDPKFTAEKAMGLLRKMDQLTRDQALAAADVMQAEDVEDEGKDPKRQGRDGTTASPGAPVPPSTGGTSSTG
jgi:hypothetical protein